MSRLKTDAIRNVNASVDGITLDTSGNVVIPNELQLADKIVHTGDTNTAIRFLANDTVSVETAGSERLRVTSGGSLIVGNQTSTNYKLCVSEAAHTRVEVISTNNDSAGAWFKVFNSGTLTSQSTIRTSGGSLQVYTGTSSESEKLRIDSSGRLLVGLTASIQNTAYLQLKGINQSDICLYWPQDAATAGSHISWRTDGGGAATEITRIFCGQATTGADGGYMTFLTHNGTSLGERMRIDSSGRVLINTITAGEATSDSLTIQTRSNHAGVTIRSSTSGSGCVYFADGTSGNAQYRGFVEYVHSSDYLKFGTTGTERLRITSTGIILANTNTTGYANRSAYFNHIAGQSWNYISITGASSGGAGIVFGDSTGLNTGNYEAYVDYNDSTKDFKINTDQGNKTFTFEAAGNLSIGDGNLKVASGHGIDFSATSGTGQSELLDDYETGSWTPVLKAGGTTITYNTGSSTRFTYTKIGNVCHIFFSLDNRTTSGGNIGGGFEIEGLPFQSGGGRQSNGAGVWYGTGFRLSAWPVVTHIGAGNSKIQLYGKTTAAGNYYTVTLSQVGANSYLFLTLTYETA